MSKKNIDKSPHSNKIDFDLEKTNYYFPALLVIMLLGVIILFKDFIFSDKMLYGSDMINAGIFFRSFYVNYFHTTGTVPVWNPYIFGGMPYIDAFHGDIYYPLSILKFFGNIFRSLGYNFVIHIFLAGIFMYFTARQFKLSKMASTVSALAYMFAGLLVSLVAPGHDGKVFVTTLFPLTILFLNRGFERKPLLNFSLLGLVIGVIILSPHPQLSYYSLWAIALYSLFKLIVLFRETKSIKAVIQPSALIVGAVVVGLFISAIQFYPGYVYTKNYSPRADTKSGWDWATSWSMNEEEALSQVVPEFSGTSSGTGNYYWGRNAFKDNSEYAGIIPLFLAIIAVFFYRRKEAIFFGCLALFAFIYALGGTTPIFKIFYYLIPNVKSLRAPSTIMFIFSFSISLLAGMGLQYIIKNGRELFAAVKKKLLIYIFAVPGGLFLLALLFSGAGESMLSLYTSIFYPSAQTTMVGQGMSKWSLGVMNLPNVQTGFWLVFLFTGLTAGVIWLFMSRKLGTVILLLIPLLVMVDGIRFDKRFIKTYDYRQQFTRNALTEYFKNQPEKFRVLNLNSVSQDYLPYFGIEVVTGYHGNQLRWYDDLLGGPSTKNKGNPNFLNLVNTKFILAPDNAGLPLDHFGPDSLKIIKKFGQINVYENDNAFPRAFMVNQYEVVPDRKDIYPKVLQPVVNLKKYVYLEEEPEVAVMASDSIDAGTTQIIDYAIDSVLIETSTPANSILVLGDNYYFKWKVYVDGQEAKLMRAYGSFRAVAVPSGEHQVLFKYDPNGNGLARMVTLLTLLLVGIILAYYLVIYIKERKAAVA
ncbi:MAG: hypothetical protein ABIJ45_02760 [Candidatus Zixiibacteriota bacterium]